MKQFLVLRIENSRTMVSGRYLDLEFRQTVICACHKQWNQREYDGLGMWLG